MKCTLKIKFAFFFVIACILLSPICMATDSAVPSNNTIQDDGVNGTYQFIASDVYEFNDKVVIDSTIDGNAFAFGNDITITGEIAGDVFVFGRNVTISEKAYIHGNIFVFAQDFIMNGICYDIYGATSGTFTLEEDSIVARDIRIATSKIHINGQIKRDAYISTNEIDFPSTDVHTLIYGNLEYSAPSEANFTTDWVAGTIQFTKSISNELSLTEKTMSFISSTISTLLYTLAIVLLTIWLAPNFKNKVGSIVQKKTPLSLGLGLLVSLVMICGSFFLLFFTRGYGIEISLAVITLYILILTISQTVFGMGCAKLISEKMKKDNLPMFILLTLCTILVIRLIGLVPYIGMLTGFAVTMIGLGMIFVHLIKLNNCEENINQEKNSI